MRYDVGNVAGFTVLKPFTVGCLFLCHQWFFAGSKIPDPGLAGQRFSALTTWSRLLLWCNYTYVAIFLSYFYLLMLMLLAYLSDMPMILLTYFGVPVPTLLVSFGVSIMLLLAHLVHQYRCHWNILVYVSTSIICFINSAITGTIYSWVSILIRSDIHILAN